MDNREKMETSTCGRGARLGTTVKQWDSRETMETSTCGRGARLGTTVEQWTAVQQWFELVELVEFFAAEGVDPGGFVVDLVGLAQRLADPHAMVA